MKNLKNNELKKRHKAYYGTIELERVYCSECETFAIVSDGVKQCCDKLVTDSKSSAVEYMTPPLGKRKKLSLKNKKILLDMQDHRCIYCNIRFGTVYWYKNTRKTAKVNYDHFSPFIYGYDNRPSNFVASCKMCNSIKHSKTFDTFEEAQRYILKSREEKGLKIYI